MASTSPVPEPAPSLASSQRTYQSMAGQNEEAVEETHTIQLLATSKGKLASLSIFTMQLVIAVVILAFFGVSGAMRDVSEAGLIFAAMSACTTVVLVAPALGLLAWDAVHSNEDGSSAGPGITVIPSERKFQHMIIALLYGLSIALLLLVGSNQQTVLNIVCVVLGSMTSVTHLLYSIVLFIKRT